MLRKITEITRAQGLALMGCDITAYGGDDCVFFRGVVDGVEWDHDGDPRICSGRNSVYLNLDDGYYILADVPDNWDDLAREDAPQSGETPPEGETPEQRVERLRAELAAAEKALRGGLPEGARWEPHDDPRGPCAVDQRDAAIQWDDDAHTSVFLERGGMYLAINAQTLFAWVDRVRSEE